jgi:hypothetical protein
MERREGCGENGERGAEDGEKGMRVLGWEGGWTRGDKDE